jgi:hypothetical protein
MDSLVIPLLPEARQRLEALASRIGLSPEDCGVLALQDFLQQWESFLRDIADSETEDRMVLRKLAK